MRMTIDGSGDDLIKIQGVYSYTFSDADGGEAGVGSGMDPDEQTLQNTEVPEAAGMDGEGDEGDEDSEDSAGDTENDSSEDDTAEPLEDQVGALQDPPTGYEIVEEAPPLATEDDLKALIGQPIMHAWATESVLGWFQGKVTHFGCSARDLKDTPSANMVVQYKKSVTKNKGLDGRVATTITADRYRKGEWWVLLKPFKE